MGSWKDGLIGEGFSQPGYMEQVKGLHPELRFEFCPVLPDDVEVASDKLARLKPTEVIPFMAKVIAEAVTSWSFSDGKPTAAVVRRMRHSQLSKLYSMVVCQREIDDDPLANDDDETTETKLGN